MTLAGGARLGCYEVIAPLGAGGMGEVYRARDSRLDREVAIKVLPAAVAQDRDRLVRFEREAKVLASLNHPNIAQIYGVEESGDIRALVMELAAGTTLPVPQPVDTALAYARQIADGLEAAHEKGITHRDLKPANIMITPEGVVKILDFGLAAFTAREAAGNPNQSPTLTLSATQAGTIMGTAAYMSPEQARGKPVDKRADIWAFGVVLYEMLAGRQLYGGETITDTLAAVITREPDYRALPADTPPRIRRLLERCLRKDPKSRLRDIGDARLILDEAEEGVAAPAAVARGQWSPRSGWLAAALLAMALGVTAWQAFRSRGSARADESMTLSLALPANTTLDVYNSGPLAFSADAKRIAMTLRMADGKSQIYTRLLREAKLVPVAGTENGSGPFFSPDGKWLGFVDLAAKELKKVSLDGGAPLSLSAAPSVRGASWGEDGNIVAALNSAGELTRTPSSGGTPQVLVPLKPSERTQRWPQVLRENRGILFTSHTANSDYDHATIDVFVPGTGQRKTVLKDGYAGRYIETGHLVYLHEGTLFAAPFDPGKLEVTGPAAPVIDKVSNSGTMGGAFAVSADGMAVYLEGASMAANAVYSVDETGRKTVLYSGGGAIFPSFSPDGKRLAFSPNTPTGTDLWVKDLERGQTQRLSFLTGFNQSPVWMRDGQRILFLSARSGMGMGGKLYSIRADGSGGAQPIENLPDATTPYSISPDGKLLGASRLIANSGEDILMIPIEGEPEHPRLGTPSVLIGTPAVEVQPAFSPDGRWLAYISNESGKFEVYVRPFPGSGGRWQVSSSGGVSPMWSRGGHQLLYETPTRGVMRVEYSTRGDSFWVEKSQPWPGVELADLGTNVAFDVAPDGKHLAAILPVSAEGGDRAAAGLTFLVNFFEEVKRRVK